MADIFLSYDRVDRERAQRLAAAIEAQGWTLWWDRHITAGMTFDEVIARGLAAARCMIVLWSTASVISHWVREDADEGLRRNILVPVLIDNVPLRNAS